MLRNIHYHPSNENAYDARRKGSGIAKATFGSFQRRQRVRYRLTPKGRHHRRTIALLRRHRRSFGYDISIQSKQFCFVLSKIALILNKIALHSHDADAADDGV
jgi:hypothetical protein